MTPVFRELDTVVLLHDRPEDGLRAGAVGAVVQVYSPDALEVEFVDPSGETVALATLDTSEVRAAQQGAA